MPNRHRYIVSVAVFCLALAAPAAAYQLQSGIGFIAITNAPVGAELILKDALGTQIGQGLADSYGSLIFRDLAQGATYSVTETGGATTNATVRVFGDNPPQSFYDGQTLVEGLNYIQTRDGTLLAAMVRAPFGQTLTPGHLYPTVIEYSGYAAADPDNPQPSTLLAQVLGYATVGINMRGSGCSGGVLDLFDYPTTADGYDAVEAVAAQPWALGHRVGMVGISFPGISQLFVAGAQPPHLAAIAPLSVIADIYRAPGFPGGIFNNGFGQTWLQERKDDAEPAPGGGQAWAITRVNNGDTTCLANQTLRLQTQDPVDFTLSEPYYTPPLMDQRSPINWVGKIKVPVLLSGAWQDEQTGSGFASLLSVLPKKPNVKVIALNGVHSSPLEPVGLWSWIAFLDLYVGGRAPDTDRLAPFADTIYDQILGPDAPTPPLPPEMFPGVFDPTIARKMWEKLPHIRVEMENGAGSPTPGLPAPTFEVGLKKWPAPGSRMTAWYLGPNGTLTSKKPLDEVGFDTYKPDPDARPMQTIPGQGQSESWEVMPDYDWQPLLGETALGYVTDPLEESTTIIGEGSVDLWLRSSDADTDIQVTVTEVRPDNLETYVQSGWLRASHRFLDAKRSKSIPYPTHLESDAAPMPADTFVPVRVAIFAFGHVFHAGSRIRLTIEAPGGDRTRWAFDTYPTNGLVVNDVARTKTQPSRVVLPVLRKVVAPSSPPPCPGLRGQPCRTYVPASNGG